MPESGLGSEVATSFDQVLPPSADQHSTTFDCWLRERAWMRPSGWVSRVGWMASQVLSSSTGPTVCQVWPRSVVRSKWTRQPRSSKLVGARIEPSLSVIGLFLTGPRKPSGRRLGLRPGLAVVSRRDQHAPPVRGGRPGLVEQPERSTLGLKEDRVPARETFPPFVPPRHLDRRRPPFAFVPRQPDADVGKPFIRPAEPGGDQSGLGFDDRRGMRGRERRILEDEIAGDQAGLEAGPSPPLRRPRGPPRAKPSGNLPVT